MFGAIIAGVSLLFGIGSSIFGASKEKKAAEKQAEETEAQYNAKAADVYNAGIQTIGDLQLGMAASGVKYNSKAGSDELEAVRTPEDLSTYDIEMDGVIPSLVKPEEATEANQASSLPNSADMDTGSLLLQQSRRALARDVSTIRETGVGAADSILSQGQQDMMSSIFGGVSNTLGAAAGIYGNYQASGHTNVGSWLKEW